MTPAEIIYHRRVAVLDYAARVGNVAEACRVFGISRTRYYEWKALAERYGLDALMPKERRAPQMPEATPTHVVERTVDPGRGRAHHRLSPIRRSPRRPGLLHRQVDRAKAPGRPWAGHACPAAGPGGRHRGSHDGSRHRCGQRRRALRVLPGQRRSGRARLPRQLLHRQPQGRGQGVPAHRHRRLHPLGLRRHRARTGDATHTVRFLDQLLRHYRRHGVSVRAVLTDNGPEYIAGAFIGPWRPRGSPTCGSRPARPTTTPWSSASTAPSSRSAGARPSTAGASPRSASSKPRPTPGSSPTTAAGATTATTCAVGPPRDPRQPQAKQGSMTTINHRAHLSPRLSVRKI